MKTNILNRILFYILLALVAIFIIISGKSKERTRTLTTTEYLDTVCDISVVSNSDKPISLCADYLEFAHNEFSADDSTSTLFKLNSGEEIKASSDLNEAIAIGDEFSKKHSEFFSIHLDSLIKGWKNFESDNIYPDVESLRKQDKINLGGIAKGFITDRLVEKLKESGVKSALINLGGNAYAMGKKQTGENWKIGIQNPKDESGIIGVITAEDIAVITSGDYQRYFEKNGKKYHHILDPITGYPAESEVHQVTVIHENATIADALSTAAFVAGVEKGNELLKSYNAMGIFITDDTIYFSKGLENIFKQSDFLYKYDFLY